MKKLILSAAVLSAFSFASCKKDHTCTCTTTSTSTTTVVDDYETSATETATTTDSNTGTDVYVITKAKKGDAKKACIDENSTSTNVSDPYDGYYWTKDEYYTETTTTVSDNKTACSLN